MALKPFDDLRRRWNDNGVLTAAEGALDQIGLTDAYISSIADEGLDYRSKVIKDNVWGMVEVGASSLRLLDSPLVQRLRGIRQLGFTYLTYPTAEHSRFAHSLGMFCVVNRFLNQVKNRERIPHKVGAPHNEWYPDDHHIQLAEHAALLHDVGHTPFSHVTENILHQHAALFACGPVSVDDFMLDAEDLLECEVKLSELLTIAFLLTERFRRFYGTVVVPGNDGEDLLRIAALILGFPPEVGIDGLASMISDQAIDADKIDYINRDASACGIAVGVDVSRLFLRSRFLNVAREELQRLRSSSELPATEEVIFVVNSSGLDSVEEIGQARSMLYHRVYLHQTTRNAERILSKAMSQAAADGGLKDAFGIWRMDDGHLLRFLGERPASAPYSAALSSRNLPKRACAFGRAFVKLGFPLEAVFPDMKEAQCRAVQKQVLGSGLEELRSRSLRGNELDSLEASIAAEASRLAELLRNAGHDAPLGLPSISVLPMPNIEENRRDCVVLENERLSPTAASTVVDEQLDAADVMKSTGYVLCENRWKDIVFLAARTVFYRKSYPLNEVELTPYEGSKIVVKSATRLRLDEQAVSQRIRMNGDHLDKVIRDADAAKYFDQFPFLLPTWDLPNDRLNAAATVLRGFAGQGGWRVSRRSLDAFISQFPGRLRREVLELVCKFSMFDRPFLASSIRQQLEAIDLAGARGFVTALSPDSGYLVRQIVEHELHDSLQSSGWQFAKSIRDVFREASTGDHIALCDDNVTSGSQATCQLKAWTGVPKEDWTEEQRNERGIEHTKLDERDIDLLRSMQLWLVTAVGTKTADENLRNAADICGIKNYQGLRYAQDLNLAPAEIGDELKGFLKSVGTSTLAWCRFGVSSPDDLKDKDHKAECENNALGYDGAGAAMCTLTNVPTGTFTAFWAPGFYRGGPWMPLLIRRGYLQKVVLS
ncbi:MAG: hypothetical protein Rhirs2KO_11280 [Rhizobiaceae bacterium]